MPVNPRRILQVLHTTQMSEEENNASQKMALAIIDQLQETGERDKLKEWFTQQLESTTWPKKMLHQATKIAEQRMNDGEKEQKHDNSSENNKNSSTNILTANQLATELMEYGIGMCPT